VRKWAALTLLAFVFSVALTGCSEPTQKEAQQSQADIQKEMKANGDDKNAY
jgi:hypothetical protein